ncbi:hypothetical protein GCM10007898_07160 [Dyella flagellata]|uniref:Late endosomal/lysosomal adaptor and MAPK and MTOR activator 5 n=2 Tax=Dyella flagellata TaxID=1867833 RepID=A0ABQ5X9E4_9GAMM|nr:hypothetical protein GCM10007898_07160 [Dyella flagellata]
METLAPRSVTLLSATHTSARFPFVSPPGELVDADGKVAGRVVDGGVHDVSGAQTALDLVRSISRGNKKDFHPIIVDLDNDPEDSAPAEDQSSNMQGIGELQTIISAISHSHNDQSALAKHELLALVCDLKGGYLSLKVDKEKAGPIGLGWTLSQSTGNVLTRAMMQDDAFLVSDHANGTTPASAMAQLVDGAKRSCEDGESRR